MIEVELKCELFPKSLPKLQERLQHMTFDATAHNVDRYYDTPRFDLLHQAAFVSVRNNHQLEFKVNEHAETSEALALLQKFIAGLDLQHIKVGYVELWLRIHNPQAYQLGKYRL